MFDLYLVQNISTILQLMNFKTSLFLKGKLYHQNRFAMLCIYKPYNFFQLMKGSERYFWKCFDLYNESERHILRETITQMFAFTASFDANCVQDYIWYQFSCEKKNKFWKSTKKLTNLKLQHFRQGWTVLTFFRVGSCRARKSTLYITLP